MYIVFGVAKLKKILKQIVLLFSAGTVVKKKDFVR